MSHYPVEVITETELRQKFNDLKLWEKAQSGELRQQLLKSGHPSPPLANEPECTRSQIIAYYNKYNNQVAIVHQYLRPDGTLGLSGKPDPKKILHNLILYIAEL